MRALYFNSLATILRVLSRPACRLATCQSVSPTWEKSFSACTMSRTRLRPSIDSRTRSTMSSCRKARSAWPRTWATRAARAGPSSVSRIAASYWLDHAEQGADIALQRTHVGVDEADRVIDFMRDAGRQLADGRHLFRLQQLVVRFLQLADQ